MDVWIRFQCEIFRQCRHLHKFQAIDFTSYTSWWTLKLSLDFMRTAYSIIFICYLSWNKNCSCMKIYIKAMSVRQVYGWSIRIQKRCMKQTTFDAWRSVVIKLKQFWALRRQGLSFKRKTLTHEDAHENAENAEMYLHLKKKKKSITSCIGYTGKVSWTPSLKCKQMKHKKQALCSPSQLI